MSRLIFPQEWTHLAQSYACKDTGLVFVLACVLCVMYLCLSQGCIFRLTCSYPELTEDHVLPSAQVKIFRTVTRNAVNKSVWRKKDCFWLPLHKHAVNIWLSSLRIRAHLSWRTGKHLHVLHVLRTYSTCSYPRYQDTTTYAALGQSKAILAGSWLTRFGHRIVVKSIKSSRGRKSERKYMGHRWCLPLLVTTEAASHCWHTTTPGLNLEYQKTIRRQNIDIDIVKNTIRDGGSTAL